MIKTCRRNFFKLKIKINQLHLKNNFDKKSFIKVGKVIEIFNFFDYDYDYSFSKSLLRLFFQPPIEKPID